MVPSEHCWAVLFPAHVAWAASHQARVLLESAGDASLRGMKKARPLAALLLHSVTSFFQDAEVISSSL